MSEMHTNTDTDADKYILNGVEVTPNEVIETITIFLQKQQFRVGRLNARIAELEAERRWIPVSERLPELGKVVHVIDMNFIEYFTKTELVYETAVLVEVNGFKMFGFVNEFSVWSSSDVTHWMYAMPLPTPPEVQE